MQIRRRQFLRYLTACGALLALPRTLLAAWPEAAFEATELDKAIAELFGDGTAEPSDAVNLKIPDIAENGAVVPVTVSTDLADVESISIFVANNPSPLAASFDLPQGTAPTVSTRIKMGQSSKVVAVVKAGGQLHKVEKEVKVTIGGCGG